MNSRSAARLSAALLSTVLLAAGCGGEEDSSVRIETRGGEEVSVDVELADSESERSRGLMNRESLAEGAGMLFLFEGEHTGGFWMKDTLIPLSIAFVGPEGRILRILDMEPCRADPCPVYDPGVTYRSALEVNRGAFAEWGVDEGDRLTLTR